MKTNTPDKPLLIGENLVAPEQKELLLKLKSELQKLMAGKEGDQRKRGKPRKQLAVEIKDTGCWELNTSKRDGYTQLFVNGILVQGHRFIYENLKFQIAPGLQLDHLCWNRGCVNPFHMEPVTQKVNILRGIGPTAINSRKTECSNGHPLSGKNLYINPGSKQRCCRLCDKIRNAGRKEYWRLRRLKRKAEI